MYAYTEKARNAHIEAYADVYPFYFLYFPACK